MSDAADTASGMCEPMPAGPDIAGRGLDAFLRLLPARGWRAVGLREVAQATSGDDGAPVPFGAFYRVYPSKVALVAAFLARVDDAVLAGSAPSLDPDETVRDRLFDTMMRRYDALAPYRDAVAALVDGLARDPLAALALVRPLSQSMAIVLEDAGVSSEGGVGALRQKVLAALHLSLLRTWLNDDSADLAKTMAALDKGLKRLGRWADVIESTRKRAIFRRRERPSPDAPAAAGDHQG